jgi:hypothetical protein
MSNLGDVKHFDLLELLQETQEHASGINDKYRG